MTVEAPVAERPWDAIRIAGEVAGELRRREPLPPGELGFSVRRSLRFQHDPVPFGLECYERFGPLARHPDVLARVQDEQRHVLGDTAPTVDQLSGELPELDMAVDGGRPTR